MAKVKKALSREDRERRIERIRSMAVRAAEDGMRRYQRMIEGLDGANERRAIDMTLQDKAVLKAAEHFHAAERAKTAANAVPKTLGIVAIVRQMDEASWEQMAVKDPEVIDAEFTKSLPPIPEGESK